ncbi:hypothetical protein HGRIS_002459 [Hohenbuehelia grisea]|uniref:Matrin-type domain-containing protein n=1 Tax=Hohenbuehelia grisea TaxID=104357 RepID=A0ABR3JL96_9AGAR
MSEYWVSKKKYYCKYCEIYIADDAPSRQQHENGLRHKGNKERFVRNIYKTGEKRKKDLEEEKREMARVERAAQAAFAQDVGAGRASSSSAGPSSASAAAPPRKPPPPKPSNPYSNYSTAESLGYTDPDAERRAAEAERHRTQGVAGAWELVETADPPASSTPPVPDDAAHPESLKREAEPLADEENARQFKLRKKTLNVGLGEIYDPGLIPIKVKKKEESSEPSGSGNDPPVDANAEGSKPTGVPKWTKVQWKRPGEDPDPSPPEDSQQSTCSELPPPLPLHDPQETPLTTVASTPVEPLDRPEVKAEDVASKTEETVPAPPEPTSLFRKRKLPGGGVGGRGRR